MAFIQYHLIFLIHFLYLLTSEGQDGYENDGFIVDDIEDEEEQVQEEKADSDDERQKKKKRKKRLVFCPHVLSPMLVIEVDVFVCLVKKTECLIINK